MAVKWNGRRIQRRVMNGLQLGMQDATHALESEIKRQIVNTPKSGFHWPQHVRRSSAPGEPPASQTGTLVRSINTRREHLGLTWNVEVTDPKARLLEYGGITKNLAGQPYMLAARPFMRPALAETGRHFLPRMARRLGIALR